VQCVFTVPWIRDPCGRNFSCLRICGFPEARPVLFMDRDWTWCDRSRMTGCDASVTAEEAKHEYDARRGGVVRAMFTCFSKIGSQIRKALLFLSKTNQNRLKSVRKQAHVSDFLRPWSSVWKMFTAEWKGVLPVVELRQWGLVLFSLTRCDALNGSRFWLEYC
jgi:hypothetical protein